MTEVRRPNANNSITPPIGKHILVFLCHTRTPKLPPCNYHCKSYSLSCSWPFTNGRKINIIIINRTVSLWFHNPLDAWNHCCLAAAFPCPHWIGPITKSLPATVGILSRMIIKFKVSHPSSGCYRAVSVCVIEHVIHWCQELGLHDLLLCDHFDEHLNIVMLIYASITLHSSEYSIL